ncbi:MAG: DnaD domain protein [Chloroflexi bacterium]|nr:DnaD domain protein [Chloroflexota bacterium]
MTIRPISGFPLSDDYAGTRVPNAVLGRVLSSVDDADVIKLVLRAVWLLERQRGYPRFISEELLRTDRVLVGVFGDRESFDRALECAVRFRVLARVSVNGVERLMLNTESARRVSLERTEFQDFEDSDDENGWDAPAVASLPTNAFRAYEENIGTLSPMIRESILAALEDFSDDEITQAIKIAVGNESRSWSFVAGVLRRWLKEGVPDEQEIRWPSKQTGERSGAESRSFDGTGRNSIRSKKPRVPEVELEQFLELQRDNKETE